MYDVPKAKDQRARTLKADKSLLQRPIIAYEASRGELKRNTSA